MAHVLSWLALEELLACAWFLIAWPLFAGWPDRGFGVAKAAGLLALTAPAWTLAWVAGIALTPEVCWTLVALIAAAAGVCAVRRRQEVADFLSIRVRHCLAAEGLWIVATAAFLLLRAASPQITGGEKFMDFAFLNAAIRSLTLPIEDPWLAGFTLNYYHFGFVGWAMVARMLGTPPPVAYNLAAAIVPGLVAAAAYSIALVLTGSRRFALPSAIALVALGNLAGAGQIASLGPAYDIWAPSRVIPDTINEFPFFTFLWADLHPHLLAMPNFLVFVALALVAFEQRNAGRDRTGTGIFALLGASAGIAAATSPWDVLPLGAVFAALLAARAPTTTRREMVADLSVFVLFALAVALSPAMSANTGGIGAGLASTHSPFGAFLLAQATWILPAVIFLGLVVAPPLTSRWTIASGAIAVALGVFSGSLTVAVLAFITILGWESLWRTRHVALFLVAPAMSMFLFAELFYVDDIYGVSLERMNTVFKLHLDAILLLGVVSGACARAAWEGAGSVAVRRFAMVMLAVAAVLASVYPAGAILSAASRHRALTLDGTAYLQEGRAADLAAITFLTENVHGRPVVVEATGEPYSYAARISANTGLPTILGWANHERVWRRSAEARDEIARRVEAVRVVYDGDNAQAIDVFRRFHVRYVVVGDLERSQYPNGDFSKFETLGRRVFNGGGTALFELGGAVTRP